MTKTNKDSPNEHLFLLTSDFEIIDTGDSNNKETLFFGCYIESMNMTDEVADNIKKLLQTTVNATRRVMKK